MRPKSDERFFSQFFYIFRSSNIHISLLTSTHSFCLFYPLSIPYQSHDTIPYKPYSLPTFNISHPSTCISSIPYPHLLHVPLPLHHFLPRDPLLTPSCSHSLSLYLPPPHLFFPLFSNPLFPYLKFLCHLSFTILPIPHISCYCPSIFPLSFFYHYYALTASSFSPPLPFLSLLLPSHLTLNLISKIFNFSML